MTNVRISIVTISYNQGQYLKQAIESVVQQHYNNLEYIVVDAGSEDGSRELIESYCDKISRIIFESDEGPADGLNKGFSVATGRIFGVVNADDYLLPNALNVVANTFRYMQNIDILSGHTIVVNEVGQKINVLRSRAFSPRAAVYGASVLAQQSTFVRAEAFRRVGGFNVENRIAWDGELWIDLALADCRFGRIDETLAAFRVYNESITGSQRYAALYKQYTKRMFGKVMGREWSAKDNYVRRIYKAVEYTSQPSLIWTRLKYGAVVKR